MTDIVTELDKHISNLAEKIEDIAARNGYDYIDAVISYCDENKLDYEIVGEIISNIPGITSKIQDEAERLNFIKSSGSRLPF